MFLRGSQQFLPRGIKVRVLVLAICFSVVSCRKDPSLYNATNLNGGRVLVFGHGGMGRTSSLPMNSAESITKCVELGADGVEMDVRRTSDGELFLFHDVELDQLSSCGGSIEKKKAAELAGCSYRKKNGSHPIVSLRELLSSVQTEPWIALDCKMGNAFHTDFADSLVSLLRTYGAEHRAMIESPLPMFLMYVKSLNPALKVYLYTNFADTALALAKRMPLDGVTIDIDRITEAEIRRLHDAGLHVTLFNVATKSDNFRALSMSPDNIQTDRPEHIVRSYVLKRD